ncbi:ATP-dependent DNA helicase RecG [Apostasia shenzhenica]|uniref:ATP-dependent DNA helicase RecG n=1 Tax=Apostasia shenzhenica TaxID=1088818 RepID=A0A2H9ZWB5_9ASPA|nr:ATP-dependent DNA helicase RecG [Apostasia shenzhenica]
MGRLCHAGPFCSRSGEGRTTLVPVARVLPRRGLPSKSSKILFTFPPTSPNGVEKMKENDLQEGAHTLPKRDAGLTSPSLETKSEKEEHLLMIKSGGLDIIVGTHALLGNRVVYKNLGLLVVDEEQLLIEQYSKHTYSVLRFGVKQKEKIASLKTSVDVLTLSATPIPRTLYLALTGFRDASLISTPPPERVPIKTTLSAYSMDKVLSAIRFELDRGGQVFYVLPRIKDECRGRIAQAERAVKRAKARLTERVVVAHRRGRPSISRVEVAKWSDRRSEVEVTGVAGGWRIGWNRGGKPRCRSGNGVAGGRRVVWGRGGGGEARRGGRRVRLAVRAEQPRATHKEGAAGGGVGWRRRRSPMLRDDVHWICLRRAIHRGDDPQMCKRQLMCST